MLQSLIVEVRALRKEIGVEEKASDSDRAARRPRMRRLAENNRGIVQRLARVSEMRFVDAITPGCRSITRQRSTWLLCMSARSTLLPNASA